MKAQDFVTAIKEFVMQAAVADVVSVVQKPPGRKPVTDLVELSAWYNALGESDRAMVTRMLALVARNAVFGFFSVLDGARSISSDTDHYFELRCVKGDSEEVLSGPRGRALHELL